MAESKLFSITRLDVVYVVQGSPEPGSGAKCGSAYLFGYSQSILMNLVLSEPN